MGPSNAVRELLARRAAKPRLTALGSARHLFAQEVIFVTFKYVWGRLELRCMLELQGDPAHWTKAVRACAHVLRVDLQRHERALCKEDRAGVCCRACLAGSAAWRVFEEAKMATHGQLSETKRGRSDRRSLFGFRCRVLSAHAMRLYVNCPPCSTGPDGQCKRNFTSRVNL